MTRRAELTGDQQALAISALTKLVRQEYPAGLSLHEIAGTWGEGITQEELDALREVPESATSRTSTRGMLVGSRPRRSGVTVPLHD